VLAHVYIWVGCIGCSFHCYFCSWLFQIRNKKSRKIFSMLRRAYHAFRSLSRYVATRASSMLMFLIKLKLLKKEKKKNELYHFGDHLLFELVLPSWCFLLRNSTFHVVKLVFCIVFQFIFLLLFNSYCKIYFFRIFFISFYYTTFFCAIYMY
jgi:hypothetical protein